MMHIEAAESKRVNIDVPADNLEYRKRTFEVDGKAVTARPLNAYDYHALKKEYGDDWGSLHIEDLRRKRGTHAIEKILSLGIRRDTHPMPIIDLNDHAWAGIYNHITDIAFVSSTSDASPKITKLGRLLERLDA